MFPSRIKELVQDPPGKNLLLDAWGKFGIVFHSDSPSKCLIDFGSVHSDDLQKELSPLPLGYEVVTNNSNQAFISQFITLMNSNDESCFQILTLKDYLPIFDIPNDSVEFHLHHSDESDIKGMELCATSSVDIMATYSMINNVHGNFNLWLLFEWEGQIATSPVSTSVTRFYTALRVIICVVKPRTLEQQLTSLSSEARIFIPTDQLQYFDLPCTSFRFDDYTKRNLCTALRFHDKLAELGICLPMEPSIKEEYLSYFQRGKLEDLATKFNLKYDPLAIEPLNHLHTLGNMTLWEEVQMSIDICYYDIRPSKTDSDRLHHVYPIIQSRGLKRHKNYSYSNDDEDDDKLFSSVLCIVFHSQLFYHITVADTSEVCLLMLKFKLPKPTPPVGYTSSTAAAAAGASSTGLTTLCCTIKVVGLSENRPKLLFQDTLIIRPLISSLLEISNKYNFHPNFPLPMFELEGTIITVQSLKELVTCQFPMPYDLCKYFQMSASAALADKLLASLLSELLYHVRFNYNRHGVVIIHRALGTVIASDSLKKSLFPPASTSSSSTLSTTSTSLSGGLSQQTMTQTAPSLINYLKLPTLATQLNSEQMKAVVSIVALLHRQKHRAAVNLLDGVPPPFIIYGPPGTGKTVTIIRAIREIIQSNTSGTPLRILACAPSDAAADVLLHRLMKFFDNSVLYRLCWWQRSMESAHPSVYGYCCMTQGIFDVDSNPGRFQIIVSTCGASQILATFPKDANCRSVQEPLRFDVVVVDESSQATEAEVLVPLSLCHPSGIIVLAGDPQQLGASPRCPLYKMCQLMSLQERLLQSGHYNSILPNNSQFGNSQGAQQHYQYSEVGVFLTKNYRSHKSILEVPSRLFYGNMLEECGDKKEITSLLHWSRLTNARKLNTVTSSYDDNNCNISEENKCAILFIGMDGKHFHDLDSPSFSNMQEAIEVCNICQDLLSNNNNTNSGDNHNGSSSINAGGSAGGNDVVPKDIGVIAAFRSQVLLIRKLLRQCNLGSVNVGEVDDFQGQEVRIAIVSTVLSSRIKSQEINGCMGLFGDHRRVNVAVTRGKALLVVVGHPDTLFTDEYWRAMMAHCYDNNTYIGMQCPQLLPYTKAGQLQQDEATAEELLTTVGKMSLLGSGAELKPNDVEAYYRNDIEWRVML